MYVYVKQYERVFLRRPLMGQQTGDSGFRFKCDADGTLLDMTPERERNYRACVEGLEDVIDMGVQSWEQRVLVCNCGSGLTPYTLADARGIPVGRVCRKCVERTKSRYRPEIFNDSQYDTMGERVEEDE